MCKCHQLTKQCQLIDEKIEEKVIEKHGFILIIRETLHFSQ
jgi:hypothetical protein